MKKGIPGPTVSRLNLLYNLLEKKAAAGVQTVFSSDIGRELGITAHSIRKDISFLGEIGNTNAGYDVNKLKQHIHNRLGLNNTMRVCITGLGRLGSALLNYDRWQDRGYELVAGFDKNINTLEILQTDIPLYPAYEIKEMIKIKAIDLAIIAVPAQAAQTVADQLIAGGIKGILNFAPVVLHAQDRKILIQNMDLLGELRLLTALLALREQATETI